MKDLIWLVPLFPLAGALVNGIGTFRPGWTKNHASITALLGSGLAWIVGWAAVADWFPGRHAGPHVVTLYDWVLGGTHAIGLGGTAAMNVSVNYLLDPLSALMVGFVTFIGFLIHVYSTGYMHGEPRGAFARYFAYLNLFMFSMLTLVLGGNFLMMFVGWEGVGLCSYLLIGFYYDRKYAADAGKKAFVTNRIGDFGFILAMFLIFLAFGSLDYTVVFARAAESPELMGKMITMAFWQGGGFLTVTLATAIGLALFLGACGKSAQLPLYVWLPDAMAGPTPVSALIHAATMVTAGVYMVTRCNIFYRVSHLLYESAATHGGVLHQFTHDASYAVAVVGVLTAFFAATIGLLQTDIKKVLAYSTVSQLGFMFLGCGVGAFVWGMFHVFTHAFFKACLFLGSGSVIHGMAGEQEITKMGGLKKWMPTTYWTMLVSTWAIAGFPWAAGFYSKDPILGATWFSGHPFLFLVGFVTAGMTAFYMYRMMYMTFTGEFRGREVLAAAAAHGGHGQADDGGHGAHGATHEPEPHESPKSMTVPLQILAVGAIAVGFLFGFPEVVSHTKPFIDSFLEPIFLELQGFASLPVHEPNVKVEYLLMGASVAVALLGWFVARVLYKDTDLSTAKDLASRFPRLHAWCYAKWKVDELYEATVIGGTKKLGDFLWEIDARVVDGIVNGSRHVTVGLSWLSGKFDLAVVDGLVNGIASVLQAGQRGLSRIQTGQVQRYAFVLGFGLFGLICLFLFF
jgi:NADH-quinone oxidoreductase subunit L